MPIVITVQTNFIRIDYVIVIPHRQFLIRHFVNLHLRKTSAFSPCFSPPTSAFSPRSAFILQPSFQPSDVRRHTSGISQPSAFILQPSFQPSDISLHPSALVSAFSLHTSALVSALRRQTSYIRHLSAFSLHTSALVSALSLQPSFRLHTSSLSPPSPQSAKELRDEQHGGSGNPDNRHAPRHRTLIAASNPSPPD